VTAADRLAALVRDAAGIELPVRVRTWDGSEAGPADAPVLIIKRRKALRRLLWAPGEMGLARAYVTGDIDVEGDLADGFRRTWAMAAERPPVSTGWRARPPQHWRPSGWAPSDRRQGHPRPKRD
jgi:cyclopropane-fatty-acyl-phospholipid synthase